ncbi:MAG: phenylalanine--tRNA ligase subunit beta [Bacteroidetes bacterium]|nr:phenylalanine--tRNA ligase subunit beta [Bacteroidota bacterium]MBS1539643.1 phenylalanine--tRNA ligase subunit beta [Bacteroidota bacterium]
MKISYHWLRQYIDIPESPEEIGQTLTSTGLEVESIETMETVKGGLKGLVIGEVLTCAKHPNADKLSVTTVDVGLATPASIVCGAPNVAAGQKVVVALPGTTVHPTHGEPFVIKSTKIRGEQSDGMICAEDEIGLGASHAGIMVLTATAKNGTSAAEFFKVETDYVFEIGLTPNRADAASHIGVARDIRAAKSRNVKFPSVENFKVANTKLTIPVSVESPLCPRFSGVSLSNIKVKESPAWLKNRLKAIGLTPINNVVDITNYVCHEVGQPLHAYDMNEIAGKKIVVKTLAEGTPFKTLDGKERKLSAQDLMVCDGESNALCMAGVFGGIHSGITEKTTSVFLEGAYWLPEGIRKTSQRHGLKTDASFRFERGADINQTVYAVKRAAMLIVELADAEISSDVVDVYPTKTENLSFAVSFKNIDRLIGKIIDREEIYSILDRLDIVVSNITNEGFSVSVPPYRVDVRQEVDVIEEILRIYGFNKIELSATIGADYLASFPEKDLNKYKKSVGAMLAANGFYEILTNSLTHLAYRDRIKTRGEAVEIVNKLSEEQGILRQTMLFSSLEVCAHNINRKQKDLKLFEFGKIYGKTPGSEGLKNYFEEERLAIVLTGNRETENWQHKTQSVHFYDLAQTVKNILQLSGFSRTTEEALADDVFEYGLKILAGKEEIGKLGKVKNTWAKQAGIKQELFFADLRTDLLFRRANPKFVVQEVPKFPEVRRDLSLVLDNRVKFAEIEALAKATEQRLIREIIAFDVYEGDKIEQGKKAYALGFTLQDDTKTLTDEEIEKVMSKLMNAFESKMGAVIRK